MNTHQMAVSRWYNMVCSADPLYHRMPISCQESGGSDLHDDEDATLVACSWQAWIVENGVLFDGTEHTLGVAE